MKPRKARRQKKGRTGSSPVSAGNPSKALFRQGLALHNQNKLAEAARIYRQILESDPKHLDSLNNLGNVLRDQGDADGAMACYREIIATDPNYALSYFNLGNTWRNKGELEEAVTCYRQSLELHPDFSPACTNLGVTLQDLGRLEDAIPWLYRAVAADARHAQAHLNLGNAVRDRGDLDEAAKYFRQAIKIDPRYIDARCNLGSLLRTQDRLEESMASYNAARKMAPRNSLVQFGIAETLRRQNKFEAALTAYGRAIDLNPNNADIHNNKGNLLRLLERMDEAQDCYRRAMEIDANHPDARLNFALLQPFMPDDPNFALLKAQLDNPATKKDKQDQLVFALARGYNLAGQYDEAMVYFVRGNARKSEDVKFSRPAHRAMIKEIREFFNTPHPLEEANAASGQQIPVILLGMSRSGKTLAESLLKQDPRVFGGGERHDWLDNLDKIREERGIREEFPECIPQLDAAMVAETGKRYMKAMGKLSNAPFAVNTLPGLYLHLGLVFQAMPTARVIYCRREPLDQCLRIYFKLYASRNIHAYTLENIAAYHDGYHALMAHWQSLYPERILEIQYEDMVRDPRAAAEKLFAHLGLEFDMSALAADFSAREIGEWRHYAAHIGPLQAALAGLTV